jgi:hypothetical protein
MCQIYVPTLKETLRYGNPRMSGVQQAAFSQNITAAAGSVAFDGEANVTGTATASTTLTITGKTTAGSNRCGIAKVSWTSQVTTITGITWNGVAMTEVINKKQTADIDVTTAIWRIVNPQTAASNVVVTFSGASTGAAIAESYNGVNQAAPTGTAVSAATSGGAASPITVTATTATGEMVVDSAMFSQFDTNAPAVGANQTQTLNQAVSVFFFALASRQSGSDGGVMSWTYSGSGNWAIAAVPLVP